MAGPGAWCRRQAERHQTILQTFEAVESRGKLRGSVPLSNYAVSQLFGAVRATLEGQGFSASDVLFTPRGKFGADVVIKVPSLLRELGSKRYATEVTPSIVSALSDSALMRDGAIARVVAAGMYVNVSLSDKTLLGFAVDAVSQSASFGRSDVELGERIVVDYSSPNAAKQLHAGHVRSTILGEVLCNLHEGVGATVHRLNHINDLGGFGFYLEGYRRWQHLLDSSRPKNEQLASLYFINKALEKVFKEDRFGDALSDEERRLIESCFGMGLDSSSFRMRYEEYVRSANERFTALERGDTEEVAMWEEMIAWSLAEFDKFYGLLKVKHDHTVGESFYAPLAMSLVNALLQSEKAEKLSLARAEGLIRNVEELVSQEKLTAIEGDFLRKEIESDVGAVVIPLSNNRRMVVLRSDGGSIYATRDLGAVYYRHLFMHPTRVIYVVGQEQKDHFSDLFEAAEHVGIRGNTRLDHLYFGFYVDPITKKKLSSRDGAANVNKLLGDAIAYFHNKYAGREDVTEEERHSNAHELARGSVIFNDLKKDRKSPVELSGDTALACEEFEKAGGAYVMYSACRARSVLRKADSLENPVLKPAEPLTDSEADILKRVAEFPLVVKRAAEMDDPSVLLGGMLELARLYNSYYGAVPVAKGGEVHIHRKTITESVALVLENGLRLCGVICPARI